MAIETTEQSRQCQTLLTTKRAHLAAVARGNGRALERGEHLVDLESLTDVLGALNPNPVPSETARAKQGGTTNCQPLLTTKQAHSELGWWGSKRALERGECLVDLESLANVLGALVANISVVPKTVRRAHLAAVARGSGRAPERGEHLVDLESLTDVLGALNPNRVPSETARAKQGGTTNCQPLLTTKRAAHLAAVARGSRRALERGEHLVDLESLTDVLGALNPNRVPSETARAKQGGTTNCQPLLTTKQAHSELGWWGSERALERGECLVDLESLANVLGALVANISVVPKTVRVKQGRRQIHTVIPC
eukprot:scaffold3362_cov121-Isochrysis_galbana.AAC.6